MSAPARATGARRIVLISIVWIGIAVGLMALAAFVLFQRCAFDGCSLEWAILFWVGVATVPFTLAGLGIHLFVVAVLPRTGNDTGNG